jgi:hypothetical protein
MKEDYSFETQCMALRRAKGSELTPKEIEGVRKLSEQHAKSLAEVARLEAELEKANLYSHAQQVLDQMLREQGKIPAAKPKPGRLDRWIAWLESKKSKPADHQ